VHVNGTEQPSRGKRQHPTLAEKLFWWRLTRKLSHRELEQRTGIGHRSIGGWENGIGEPDYDAVSRIAEALEIPTSYLWDHDAAPLDTAPPLHRGRRPDRHAKAQG